jgi:hypothetical protein
MLVHFSSNGHFTISAAKAIVTLIGVAGKGIAPPLDFCKTTIH